MQERGQQGDRRREKALARATRVEILSILARGSAGLRQIVAETEDELAVVVYHLRVLVACSQIEPDPETAGRLYRLRR